MYGKRAPVGAVLQEAFLSLRTLRLNIVLVLWNLPLARWMVVADHFDPTIQSEDFLQY